MYYTQQTIQSNNGASTYEITRMDACVCLHVQLIVPYGCKRILNSHTRYRT